MVVSILMYLGLIVCSTAAVVFLTRAALTWILPKDLAVLRFIELTAKLSDPSKREVTDFAAVYSYDDAAQPLGPGDFRDPAYAVHSVTDIDGYAVYVVSNDTGMFPVDKEASDRSIGDDTGPKPASDQVLADVLDVAVPDTPESLIDGTRPKVTAPSENEILDVAFAVNGVVAHHTPSTRMKWLSRIRLKTFLLTEKLVGPVLKILAKVRFLNDIVITREEASSAPRRLAICSAAAVGALAAVVYHVMTAENGLNIVALTLLPAVVALFVAAAVYLATAKKTIQVRRAAKDRVVKATSVTKGFWPGVAGASVFIGLAFFIVTSFNLQIAATAALSAFVMAAIVRGVVRSSVKHHSHSTADPEAHPVIRLDLRSQFATAVFIIAAAAFAVGL